MTTRIVLLTSFLVAMATLVAPKCSKYPEAAREQSFDIVPTLRFWESLALIAGFGVVALVVSLMFIGIRRICFNDVHLMDTLFDGGGNNNFAVVASAVVSRWLWAALYLPSFGAVYMFGLVGQFWLAAATSVQLLLFAIIAVEFRTKAPGAKTFLQVIHGRFGTVPHVVFICFALLINIFVIGLTLAHGTHELYYLTQDVAEEVVLLIICICASLFTLAGGVGGSLYVGYFVCSGVLAIVLLYFFASFYVVQGQTHSWGFRFQDQSVIGSVCEIVQCGQTMNMTGNLDNSVLTFSSTTGLMTGIITLLAGFSFVTLNQSFWSAATTAKPRHSAWGFLTAGLAFFGIPFMMSFTFGMGHWVHTVLEGLLPIGPWEVRSGLLPTVVSHRTLGIAGDYMIAALTILVVIIAVSSQINSLTAIFMYDIYQTYINQFQPPDEDDHEDEEDEEDEEVARYRWYNRRCRSIRHAAVVVFSILTFPAAIVYTAIDLDSVYKLTFIAILCGSAVFPVAMSILWHRTTGIGACSGAAAGCAAGLGVWLVYSLWFPGGLNDFLYNTSRQEVLVASMATSLVVGAVVCLMVSLLFGGLDLNRTEEFEWEKVRKLDNPLRPWATQYANDVPKGEPVAYEGTPSYEQVREQYRAAGLSSYIVGLSMTVVILIAWPALMLFSEVFTCAAFTTWTIFSIVLAIVSAIYLGLMPPVAELVQLCIIPTKLSKVEDDDDDESSSEDDEESRATDTDIIFVTSNSLATAADVAPCRPIPDDDSSVVDNSDGLNVLSDPRAPPPKGGRKKATTKPAPKSNEPVKYPLSSASCVTHQHPYSISATDIPSNAGFGNTQIAGRTSVQVD